MADATHLIAYRIHHPRACMDPIPPPQSPKFKHKNIACLIFAGSRALIVARWFADILAHPGVGNEFCSSLYTDHLDLLPMHRHARQQRERKVTGKICMIAHRKRRLNNQHESTEFVARLRILRVSLIQKWPITRSRIHSTCPKSETSNLNGLGF